MRNENIFICIIMFVFVFTSCIHDNISSSVEEDKGFGLTVKEAKTFWENQILTRYTPQTTITLDPGDYIPVWDKSILSHKDSIANVDIPISAEIHYKVLRSNFTNRNIQIHKVDVTQKIVITKNINSKKISQYLVTLIPEYNKGGNINEHFTSLGNKKDYSGWAIYFLSFMRSPFKIEKYQRGEKVLSIVLPKEKGKKPLSLSNLKMILGHMQISAYKTVTTRSSEDYDDFWDWFENEVWANGEDGDHLTMEHEDGDWWLEDQNGNQYDIPDGLMNNNDIDISGPDTNSDFDYSDPPEPDNIESSDAIPYFKAKIYHKICGTYLGEVDLGDLDSSSHGSGEYYCSKCLVWVHVEW